MALSAGDRLGRYEILGPLGAGGMGEVYRAHDERLDRDVAIKVLPESVAQNPDRLERFEREAKAVAKLSHPNILDIHDYGREGEITYSVTELLEGETLRERLEGGSLGWRQATEIGAAIADGLASAHEAGIVHRDLKPSNVFLTADGRVKVLDFGLARHEGFEPEKGDTHSPTLTKHTDPGTVLGTVGYMSPEQVSGETADQRSDIFSLGCVLYEMVSGSRAFARDTAVETMNAILKEEPSDLRSLAGDMPPSLANIVRRCLEKRPEARFQSGQDLAYALRAALQDDSGPVARAATKEKSIVVLPFDNLSPDPDQEYFSDGLTGEIISDLAKVRALRVISRTSAMQLKGTEKDLRTIGRELNVGYVLEGSVRRAGNALRMTAQLIDAATDTHLWAEKYTGTTDDVFDIQEEVSRAIVDALQVRITPEENRRIAERPIDNAQAYECYFKAREEWGKFSEHGLDRALHLIQTGLQILGDNELLYAGLGNAYAQHFHFGTRKDESYLTKTEECIEKVFGLNPESPRGHYLKGFTQWWRGRAREAVKELKMALAIDPNDSDTLIWLGWIYAISGKGTAGRPLLKRQ